VFWQPPPDDADRIIAGLLELAGRIGRPAVLVPTDDAGAIFLAEQGGPLRDSFLFPDPPTELPRQLAGKYSLFQLCRDRGVPSPKAMLAWSAGEAADFAATAGFPVIGKLATPWRAAGWHDGPPLRSTTIIHDRAELAEVWLRCTEAGLGLMLQEYLPGGPGQDWFFHGYCDTAGRCQPAFTGVKDRSYPAYAGLTSLGRAVPNTELREQATGLLGALGFRGIVDLDLRFDPRDGQYKLLDFNPRLGAQFRLFEDTAGVDVARAAYLDLTGQPMAGRAMVAGRRFLVENYDPLGAAGYWRAGQLGLTTWAASLRRVDELAWFARDDLRPFGLMCLRMGWRAVHRPWTRGSSAQPRAAGGPRYLPGRGLKGRPPAARGAPEACSRRAGARREAAIGGSREVSPPEYRGETA
jgi:predicted ATP-grasp superfamily ATP-dependent carboligase